MPIQSVSKGFLIIAKTDRDTHLHSSGSSSDILDGQSHNTQSALGRFISDDELNVIIHLKLSIGLLELEFGVPFRIQCLCNKIK